MYYVVYVPLYLMSLLPLRFLYLFSDLAYFLLYYVIRYRRPVVEYNLSVAFPEKSVAERKTITKKFYQSFADNFIETIKVFSASNEFITRHFTGDFSLFEELYKRDIQKVQVHIGHNFNWEFGSLSFALNVPYTTLTVYMPITNKIFDRIFHKMRAKTGAKLLSATNIRNEILPHRNERYALALVADQNPANPKSGYWVPFFNRLVPFLKAPESGARRGNIPVVFCYFTKEKRGYYKVHFVLADEQPAATAPGQLTKKYAQFLEAAIRRQPENWLWSHRRWKWEWREEYGNIIS